MKSSVKLLSEGMIRSIWQIIFTLSTQPFITFRYFSRRAREWIPNVWVTGKSENPSRFQFFIWHILIFRFKFFSSISIPVSKLKLLAQPSRSVRLWKYLTFPNHRINLLLSVMENIRVVDQDLAWPIKSAFAGLLSFLTERKIYILTRILKVG